MMNRQPIDMQNNMRGNEKPAVDPSAGAGAAPPQGAAYAPSRGAAYAPPARAARTYTAKEQALGWISVAVGYLFCRTFFIWNKPFIGLIFTVALFSFGFAFYGKTARRARSFFYPVSAGLLSLSLFFSGSGPLKSCVFLYTVAAFFLFCQTGGKHTVEKLARRFYIREALTAIFAAPIAGFVAAFHAAGRGKKENKVPKTLLFILIGLLAAILPTMIVFALLSFDERFTSILGDLTQSLGENALPRLFSLLFGVPVGAYFFGALFSSEDESRKTPDAAYCTEQSDRVKRVPVASVAAVLIPILFLYGVFIYAQGDFYAALFSGKLPEAQTFSSFARDGFFKLCGASAVNLLLAILMHLFSKKTGKGQKSPVVKGATVILSLVTVALALTAIPRMTMYVSAYGLTRLRLYTLWFMILLAVVFLLAALVQFIPRVPFAAVALTVFVLFFGALAIPDTDAFIAEHNYDCYLSGESKEIDISYLSSLGDSAVPTLVKLSREEGVAGDRAKIALVSYLKNGDPVSFENFSLPALRAKSAMETLTEEEKAAIAAIAPADPSKGGRK